MNIYSTSEHPNMKQTLTKMKREIHINIIIVWYYNILLSIMDRTPRQKIGMKTVDLHNTVDQMDWPDI
jgi:hypothetical protein